MIYVYSKRECLNMKNDNSLIFFSPYYAWLPEFWNTHDRSLREKNSNRFSKVDMVEARTCRLRFQFYGYFKLLYIIDVLFIQINLNTHSFLTFNPDSFLIYEFTGHFNNKFHLFLWLPSLYLQLCTRGCNSYHTFSTTYKKNMH